ncbi:MAG: PAS domain S-box protein [Rhodocyclales bacterium]|nr:PAS domain S-box protein [Rhodocyclales bacterium]
MDKESFRRAVEWAPSALVMVDADGRIMLANVQAAKLFGYEGDELLGRPVEILVPERFGGHHPSYREGFLADPQPRPMGSGRDLYARRKDGSEFPVEIGLTPIDAGGGFMVLAAILDISERKRQAERFRRIVEYSPYAKVMIDRAGTIVLVNARTEVLFGYARAQLLGQPVEMLVPERLRGHHGQFRDGFFNDPGARPMGMGRELFGRHADGSEFPVEIGLNPIESEEGLMVLAAIVDITERRRAQQKIEDALTEKTVLLNEIHHRVKNNLQVISSLINLQANNTDDPRLREVLNESLNRVKAMALTHQLLYERKDYSSIDLGEYLGRLTQLLLSAYRLKGGSVELELVLPADKVQLDMERSIPCGLVVNELVTNSFKHGFPDGRNGRITVELKAATADEIVLRVSDDGVGLPPDFNIDNARSLGLQLVPLLVDQLLGTLAIGRAPGAHFSVRFPRNPVRRE